MNIQIDSREKAKAIKKIVEEFDKQNIRYFVSKLYVGDYLNLDNPRLVIDRKQNLSELCSNVCQDHARFRNELLRANEHGIEVVILCEHGGGIKSLEDVHKWQNPRQKRRIYDKEEKRWIEYETKAMSSETLQKVLATIETRYKCKFVFCDKRETGKKIIDILKGEEEHDS